MTRLRILVCGTATSIQDRGRVGWLRYGISASGAADPMALAAANALVGNASGAAAIELVFLGLELETVGGPARLALTGARMPIRLDGVSIIDHTSFVVQPGQRLQIGAASAGVYAVLAIEGGLAIPEMLGSRSLHRRAAIGGLDGRVLAAGDELPLARARPSTTEALSLTPLPLSLARPLRTVLGPQADRATRHGIATFLTGAFEITREVDRMACRLAGPPIELASGFNIVSDGIVAGSVQVPGSGLPIVMLCDRQTVGGYPKIATIITPDLRLLTHRRTGEAVRFSSIAIEEAQAIARRSAGELAMLSRSVRPLKLSPYDLSNLGSINFAGHASSASDPLTWHP